MLIEMQPVRRSLMDGLLSFRLRILDYCSSAATVRALPSAPHVVFLCKITFWLCPVH